MKNPERVAAAGDADKCDIGERSGHGRRQRQRGVGADQVDHHVGALAACQIAHLGGRLVTSHHAMVGAELAHEAQRRRVGVDDDDPGRAEMAQDLDGHVAEPTGADDDSGRAGDEPMEGPLDGVIWRQSSVGQRRRLGGVETAQGNEEPGAGHHEEVGHATVASEPAPGGTDLGSPLAVVLHALPAAVASPAPPRPVDQHRLAHFPA